MSKRQKLLSLSIVMMFLLLGSVVPEVFADCPNGSGYCDVSVDIDMRGLTNEIGIGPNNGILNTTSSGGGLILIGENAGSSLQDYVFMGGNGQTSNVRGTVMLGTDAGKYLPHSMHSTIIGYGANGVVCSPTLDPNYLNANLPEYFCPSDLTPENSYKPSYSTIVGGLAGQFNVGNGNTMLGVEAGRFVTTGDANIIIGLNSAAGHERPGNRESKSIQSGSFNIHIGEDTEVATSDISSSIALGSLSRVEASHQIVVGSGQFWKTSSGEAASCPQCDPSDFYDWGLFTESYWGSGVTSVDPRSFSFNASGGKGPNVPGATLTLAGGKSTGAADGGYITFQTSSAGESGSSQNLLEDRVIIAPNGNVGIGSAIPQSKLDVRGDVSVGTNSSGHDVTFWGPSGTKRMWWDSTFARLTVDTYGDNYAFIASDSNGARQAAIFTGAMIGFGTITNDSWSLYSDNTVRMHISSTGKVGIGTTNPLSQLAVSGLPISPPDSSGNAGIVCITNDGNMWVDSVGDLNCNASN